MQYLSKTAFHLKAQLPHPGRKSRTADHEMAFTLALPFPLHDLDLLYNIYLIDSLDKEDQAKLECK